MDRVRLDLYRSIIFKMMGRPPTWEMIRNFSFYKLSQTRKNVNLSHFPLSLVVYVNKTCNYKCSFCYNQDTLNKKNAKEHDLTPEQFSKLLETPAGKGALRIAFLGGEPFLNSHLFEFAESAFKKRKITNVVTNASQLQGEKLKDLLASKLDVIGLSLYENNFSHVERVVNALNLAKKPYWVQTVSDVSRLDVLKERMQFLAGIQCRNLIISNYNPYFDQKYEAVLYDDNLEYFEFEKELKKTFSQKMNIQWMNPLKKSSPDRKSCSMPFSYAHVDNQGRLGPCCFRYPDAKYGNIYEKEGWNTDSMKEIRSNLLDGKAAPMSECGKCENLYRDLYGI